MSEQELLDKQLEILLDPLALPSSSYGDIDTYTVLHELAANKKWMPSDFKKLEFISKRMEINGKLYLGYKANERKAVDTTVDEPQWLEIVIAILLKSILLCREDGSSATCLKRFNALFKALDSIEVGWLSDNSPLGIALENSWQALIGKLPGSVDDLIPTNWKNNPHSGLTGEKVTEIPLIVLFYEGPIARAYLEAIKSMGFRPSKIVEMVSEKDIVSGKPVGRWLPEGMRLTYASSIQRSKIHHWSRQLLKQQKGFVESLLDEVASKLKFDRQATAQANALSPLESYSDNVESMLVGGLRDQKLYQYLHSEPRSTILFTGGGMVPSRLLEIEQLKFLHVHPGHLPELRGADCVLWSSLLSGHTSASCFYLSSGIDTGDILRTCWLPKFQFDLDIEDLDHTTIYRILYCFLDPWVRAFALREVLEDSHEVRDLASTPQRIEEGTTFHFAHKKLQDAAISSIFKRTTV